MMNYSTTIRGSKYQLRTYRGTSMIMDSEADFKVGAVVPRFRVLNMHGDEIAVVKSPQEAVKALEQWDAKNPPEWECDGRDQYEKATPYGVLRIERQSPAAPWLVSRDDGLMVSSAGPVEFEGLLHAKMAADAHVVYS
jgi:hypothetical protein